MEKINWVKQQKNGHMLQCPARVHVLDLKCTTLAQRGRGIGEKFGELGRRPVNNAYCTLQVATYISVGKRLLARHGNNLTLSLCLRDSYFSQTRPIRNSINTTLEKFHNISIVKRINKLLLVRNYFSVFNE